MKSLFMSRNGHDKSMTKMYGNRLMFWVKEWTFKLLETEKDMSRCQLHLAAYNVKHSCYSRMQSLKAFRMSGIKRRYQI